MEVLGKKFGYTAQDAPSMRTFHGTDGRTYGPTDLRTDTTSYRDAKSHLKTKQNKNTTLEVLSSASVCAVLMFWKLNWMHCILVWCVYSEVCLALGLKFVLSKFGPFLGVFTRNFDQFLVGCVRLAL